VTVLLQFLGARGLSLHLTEDEHGRPALALRGPEGQKTAKVVATLRERKADLIAYLTEEEQLAQLAAEGDAEADRRYQTTIQEAYLAAQAKAMPILPPEEPVVLVRARRHGRGWVNSVTTTDPATTLRLAVARAGWERARCGPDWLDTSPEADHLAETIEAIAFWWRHYRDAHAL
jgi:hypothetical protein